MKTKIGFFFILTILIPTSLLAYFGLLAVRNEKIIVEKSMRQKYEAMAGIVEEEIKTICMTLGKICCLKIANRRTPKDCAA